MANRETQLEAARRANAALRVQAERLLAAYVVPESDRTSIIDEPIALFDGPAQREARTLEAEALSEPWWEHRPWDSRSARAFTRGAQRRWRIAG